jgi:hypothetical protein
VKVAANVFASFYQCHNSLPGYFMLQLHHANGSIVNPERAGFILQNLTRNQYIMEVGVGKEAYFLISITERYSLQLYGMEVWSYGTLPDPLSQVCQFYFLYALKLAILNL